MDNKNQFNQQNNQNQQQNKSDNKSKQDAKNKKESYPANMTISMTTIVSAKNPGREPSSDYNKRL